MFLPQLLGELALSVACAALVALAIYVALQWHGDALAWLAEHSHTAWRAARAWFASLWPKVNDNLRRAAEARANAEERRRSTASVSAAAQLSVFIVLVVVVVVAVVALTHAPRGRAAGRTAPRRCTDSRPLCGAA